MKTKKISFILPMVLTSFSLVGCGHEHTITKIDAHNPTCTENGNVEYWKCTSCEKLFDTADAINEITAESVVTQKTGHRYGQVSYSWDQDTKAATASRSCLNAGCTDVESETKAASKTGEIAATCEHGLYEEWSATFDNVTFGSTSKHFEVGQANPHTYGTPSYAWDDTTRTCTASASCANCTYVLSETATMTSVQKTGATCVDAEVKTFTATFVNDNFTSQEKDYAVGNALGHEFTALEITGDLNNKSYVSGQKVSLEGITITGTCARGDSVNVSLEDVTVSYANGGETLLAGETSVTVTYSNVSKVITIEPVAKLTNSVSGLDTSYEMHCGDTFVEEEVNSAYGTLSFAYTDKDGNPATNGNFDANKSPYTVVASVTEGNEYLGTTQSATIVVSHNFEDSATCNCGAKSVDKLFFVLKNGGYDIYTNDATGSAASFVKNASAEWYNEAGSAELTITPEDEGKEINAIVVVGEEAVRVSGTVVTMLINDVATLKEAIGKIYTAKDAGGNSGYYLVTQDIPNAGNLGENTTVNNFKGTFDGNGHVIGNFNAYGYGFFGDTTNATIKNVRFIGAKNNRLLRYSHGSITYENFEYNLVENFVNCGAGDLMGYFDGQLTMKNVVLSGLNRGEGEYAIAKTDSSSKNPIFENVRIKSHPDVKLVQEVQNEGKVTSNFYGDGRPQNIGITYIDSVGIEVNERIIVDLTTHEFDLSGVTRNLDGWTITNDIGSAMDWSSAVAGEGKVSAYKVGEKTLTFNAIYATKIIKTAADFESLTVPVGTLAQGKIMKEGYYILGNDIENVNMRVPAADIGNYYGVSAGSLTSKQYAEYSNNHDFRATVDGNGHKITNLTSSNHTYLGLFGGSMTLATIKNLTIDGFKSGWGANGGNYQLGGFGYSLMSTTFSNLNIKLAVANSESYAGIGSCNVLGSYCSNRVVIKDVNIDFNNTTIQNPSNSNKTFSLFNYYVASSQYSVELNNVSCTNLADGYNVVFARSLGTNATGTVNLTNTTGIARNYL